MHTETIQKFLFLAMLLSRVVFNLSTNEDIRQSICPAKWNSTGENCSREFDTSNNCTADSICRFYNSKLHGDLATITTSQNTSFSSDANCTGFLFDEKTALATSNESVKTICTKGISAQPLGMQSLRIKNHQISSSSSLRTAEEPIEYSARFARLGNEFVPGTSMQGGWCSNSTEPGEFLQIDFNKVVLLTKIESQGIRDRICNRWTTHLNISYRRNSDAWIEHLSDYGNQTFLANNNAFDIVTIVISKPIASTGIRLYPVGYGSDCKNAIAVFCFRVELYGFDLTVPSVDVKEMDEKRSLHQYCYYENSTSYHHYNQLEWPAGPYALPAPLSGCHYGSNGDWRQGWRLYDQAINYESQSSSSQTPAQHLLNTLSSEYFIEMFCTNMAKDKGNMLQFPRGDYCIYMLGENCPIGFQEGSISFYEDAAKGNTTRTHLNGITPRADMMFNQSDPECCFTRIYYCCRNDDTFEDLSLPASMPFYLLPKASHCPNVTDAEANAEFVDFLLSNTGRNSSEISTGSIPYITAVVNSSKTVLRYHLCYYQPRVTEFEKITLMVDWREETANANYELDIKLALFIGRNMIKFLNESKSLVNVSLTSNCSVLLTATSLQMFQGEGTYSGALSTNWPCQQNVTISFEVPVSLGTLVKASKQINLVAKTNILVLVYADDLASLPGLRLELTSLQNKHSNRLRDINVTIQFYHDNMDLRKSLRDVAKSAGHTRSHPKRIHGIVAINYRNIQDLIESFVNVNDIPLVTGSTKPMISQIRENTTLRFTMNRDSNMAKLCYELKLRNISTLIIIRSKTYKISTGFAYALQKYDINIENDIIIEDDSSYKDIRDHLKILRARKTNVYFLLNNAVASELLIAACELKVSPRNGYTWIHGSRRGVYETAVASRECYKHTPRSCSEEFDGVLMYSSVVHVDANEAYLDQAVGKLDSNNLGNVSSSIHMELLKLMYIDGTENLIRSFLNLTKANSTIKTVDVIQIAASIPLSRLKKLQLTASESESSNINTSQLCVAGWMGRNCTLPSCLTQPCRINSGRCVANEICECYPGYFGMDCSGQCINTCMHGICNDGRLGTGTCLKCDWLYSGVYCDTASVLQALIASCLGTLVVAVIATCYGLRTCKPKPHQIDVGDKDEAKWILDFNTLTNMEQVQVDRGVAARHLSEKIRYTDYYKAVWQGKDVFVQCIKKKPVKLSLDVRIEIRKITQLDHINIEKVVGVCLGPPYVAIVTGLASMGSLYDTLNAENVDIPIEIKYTFMEDICRGMLYLHEKCGITHGRLKSTNCLLHKGWRVKVTDIGLYSLRKRYNNKLINQSRRLNIEDETKSCKQDAMLADYNSLLWSAPEYLGAGITNIDQIEHVLFEGDVYSFGILMAEILTRTPPYGEIKVMSPQHIIEAIAHLREPMVDLEVIRPGTSKAKDDSFIKAKVLRPRVKEAYLPKDEPGRSLLRLLMESAWSDEPGDRPPFSHIKTVLRIIAPLKGDQMAKRAFLLEKETEVLEKYIAHDTRIIDKEREKINDWFKRVLPDEMSEQFVTGQSIDPRLHRNVSVAAFQMANLHELVTNSNPDELITLIDYIAKMFNAVASNQGFDIAEFSLLSGTTVMISGEETMEENQAEKIVHLSLKILKMLKKLVITFKTDFRLNFKAAIHSGPVISGLVYDFGETPRLKMIGETVRLAVQLSKQSKPNCLLITNTTAKLLRNRSKIKLIQRSNTSSLANHEFKLFWVALQE